MTQLMDRKTQTVTPRREPERGTMWDPILWILGALSAVAGLVLWFVEDIKIFGWELEAATVNEGWRYAFLIAAGALFAVVSYLFTRRAYVRDLFMSSRVVGGTTAVVASLAVSVVFAIMWIV